MIGTAGLQETQINITGKKDKELMDAACQFEAVFIDQLFKALDATIEKDESFHGGKGEEIFRSMFFDEMAKDISSSSTTSFGIAKQIYEQMKDLV